MPAPTAQMPTQAAQFDPAKLADIYLPGAITFWPVAPGWWILLGILIFFLLVIIYLIKRKPAIPVPTGKELKSQAMQELNSIKENYESLTNPHETVKKLSIFLRRYALSLYQRDNIASLTDEQWLTLLDEIIAHDSTPGSNSGFKESPFSHQFSVLLTQVPYQSAHTPIDTHLLMELFAASEILIKNSFKRFTAKVENKHV